MAGLNFLDTDFTKILPGSIKAGAFIYGSDINNGLKFSKMDNTGTITVIEGGGGIAAIIPITYADLRTAMTGATLVAGQMYIITDFATVYDQPDYDAAGAPKVAVVTKTSVVEPLVIQATSTTTISNNVFSPSFPFDEIEYNVLFNTTEYMAAPAKGRISLRIDNLNNKEYYDLRTILFIRYESAPASGIFNEFKDNGGATTELLTWGTGCFDNTLSDFTNFHLLGFPFILPNNVFGNNCIYNVSLGPLFNNTFADSFGTNEFLNFVFGSIFGSNCFNNIFLGNNVITLGSDSYGNTFGYATNGTMGSTCYNNNFGNNNLIALGNQCNNNTLGNGNTLTTGNGFTGNFIANNNTGTLGNDNNRNNIGSNNPAVTFGNNNSNIVAGNNNTIITLVNNNFNNNIANLSTIILGSSCRENSFGNQDILTIPSNSIGNISQGNNQADPGTFNAPLLKNVFGYNTIANEDFSLATVVYGDYQSTSYNPPNGVNSIWYIDNANTPIYSAVNA